MSERRWKWVYVPWAQGLYKVSAETVVAHKRSSSKRKKKWEYVKGVGLLKL